MFQYGRGGKINTSPESVEICAYDECKNTFTRSTHNQKYCSDECCRLATNKRTMERYYEKRAIKNGSIRHCQKCKTKLSRYNYEQYCSICMNSKQNDNRKKLMEMMNAFK